MGWCLKGYGYDVCLGDAFNPFLAIVPILYPPFLFIVPIFPDSFKRTEIETLIKINETSMRLFTKRVKVNCD